MKQFNIRCTADCYTRWQKTAIQSGHSLSSWARLNLDRACGAYSTPVAIPAIQTVSGAVPEESFLEITEDDVVQIQGGWEIVGERISTSNKKSFEARVVELFGESNLVRVKKILEGK